MRKMRHASLSQLPLLLPDVIALAAATEYARRPSARPPARPKKWKKKERHNMAPISLLASLFYRRSECRREWRGNPPTCPPAAPELEGCAQISQHKKVNIRAAHLSVLSCVCVLSALQRVKRKMRKCAAEQRMRLEENFPFGWPIVKLSIGRQQILISQLRDYRQTTLGLQTRERQEILCLLNSS